VLLQSRKENDSWVEVERLGKALAGFDEQGRELEDL
jgi:hypothetical protein